MRDTYRKPDNFAWILEEFHAIDLSPIERRQLEIAVASLEGWCLTAVTGAKPLDQVTTEDIEFATKRQSLWRTVFGKVQDPVTKTPSAIIVFANLVFVAIEDAARRSRLQELLGGFILLLSPWEQWRYAA